jgi:hypothetical protein
VVNGSALSLVSFSSQVAFDYEKSRATNTKLSLVTEIVQAPAFVYAMSRFSRIVNLEELDLTVVKLIQAEQASLPNFVREYEFEVSKALLVFLNRCPLFGERPREDAVLNTFKFSRGVVPFSVPSVVLDPENLIAH